MSCPIERFHMTSPVADPDLELRGGGGGGLITLLAFLPSVISSFFTQNKRGRAPPLDPPLDSRQPYCSKAMFVHQ